MDRTAVDAVARAVLYEGYLLYPYRPSAVKNQKRWNFGVLSPQAWSEAQTGADTGSMHTECLVQGSPASILEVDVLFLQLQRRRVGKAVAPGAILPGEGMPELQPVESLEVNGQIYTPWEEAVERVISLPPCPLSTLTAQTIATTVSFPAAQTVEPLTDAAGTLAGVIERTRQSVRGVIEIAAQPAGDGVYKISVHIANRTPFQQGDREAALLHSMVSTHAILGVEAGTFLSLLETPEPWQELAAGCRNEGAWPVLVGEPGVRNRLLASPIILYDYPRIAPESAGDLFDGTEIDELLSLRILTLTEEEKREIRRSDELGRQLLERTEHLPAEHLMKLHGTLRGLRSQPDESS